MRTMHGKCAPASALLISGPPVSTASAAASAAGLVQRRTVGLVQRRTVGNALDVHDAWHRLLKVLAEADKPYRCESTRPTDAHRPPSRGRLMLLAGSFSQHAAAMEAQEKVTGRAAHFVLPCALLSAAIAARQRLAARRDVSREDCGQPHGSKEHGVRAARVTQHTASS
jgi:hypothetical protein